MELRHVRYFATLAEELHFGRAAERLRIAQPTLSQQVRRLEDELEVQLLVRTKRRVQLTDAGRTFLGQARELLNGAERAVRATRLASRGHAGELAIGATEASQISILPRILPVFRQRFPGVRLTVESLNTTTQLHALREGRIHVGFLRLPCEESDPLELVPILREPLVLVLPRSHPLAACARVPWPVLAKEPCISFPRRLAPGFHDTLMSHCRRLGVTLNVVMEAEHFHAQQNLVALGFGLSLQPASIQVIRREGLVYRPLAPPTLHAELGMACRRDGASETLSVFRAVVADVFSSSRRRQRAGGGEGRRDGGRS